MGLSFVCIIFFLRTLVGFKVIVGGNLQKCEERERKRERNHTTHELHNMNDNMIMTRDFSPRHTKFDPLND